MRVKLPVVKDNCIKKKTKQIDANGISELHTSENVISCAVLFCFFFFNSNNDMASEHG